MVDSQEESNMDQFLNPLERIGIRADSAVHDLSPDLHFCLVARVITGRGFSRDDFINTMMGLWKFAKGLTVKTVASDTFLFRFQRQSDMKDVLDKEPWSYGGNLILLEQVTPSSSLHNLNLRHVSFWVHAHKVPWMRMTDKTAKLIGDTLGTYVDVRRFGDFDCIGETLRIRIRLDAYIPLCRRTVINFADIGDREVEFTYERLPGFCAFCGLISHWTEDCPHGALHPTNKADFLFTEELRETIRVPKPRRFPRSTPVEQSHQCLSSSEVGCSRDMPESGGINTAGKGTVTGTRGEDFSSTFEMDRCHAPRLSGYTRSATTFGPKPDPMMHLGPSSDILVTEAVEKSQLHSLALRPTDSTSLQASDYFAQNTPIDHLAAIGQQSNVEECASLKGQSVPVAGVAEIPTVLTRIRRQTSSQGRSSKRQCEKQVGRTRSTTQH